MGVNSKNLKTRNSKELKNFVILFLLGFVVLSPASSKITLQYMHLPLALPELLFIPFIPFLLTNYNYKGAFSKLQWVLLFLLWFLFLIIGCLNFSPVAVISTSKTWLYIITIYCLFNKKDIIPYQDIFIISVGSIIGWLAISLLNVQSMIKESKEVVTYGPMLAVEIAIVYCIIKKYRIKLILMIALCILVGIVSALRREIAIVIISIISTYLLILIMHPQSIVKYLVSIGVLCVVTISFYSTLTDKIKEISPFLYYRVIEKSEQLFEGENDSDTGRANLIIHHISTLYQDAIPRGFVNKQYSGNDKEANGDYNDVPLIELSTTFGFILAILLILYFIYADFRIYELIIKKSYTNINLIIVCGGIVIMALLFIEGSYFTFAYCAPYTGYMLGTIQKKSKLKLKITKELL